MDLQKSARVLVPVPPDGGWGWIVLIGSFLAYFLADGWSFSFGVLFPTLLDNFEEGKGKTSLIAALLYGVPMLLSPIACALTTCYGCRIVAVFGGLFTAIAILLSAFATSVNFLCASIGLFSSLGLVMTYIPSLFIVTFYFDKHRGFATGLAMMGSGLGSIVVPPIMNALCDTYSWRGFLLIMGGLCLHIVFAGLLFRPPPMGYPKSSLENLSSTTTDEDKNKQTLQSSKIIEQKSKSCLDLYQAKSPFSCRRLHQKSDEELRSVGLHQSVSSPILTISDIEEAGLDISEMVIVKPQHTSHGQKFKEELRMLLVTMLDRSLARNWAFLLFCASNFILYLWVGVPYIFLIDRALELDVASQGNIYFLSSIIGIGRTIGQIVLGYIGDRPKVNTNILYGMSAFLVGVATVFVPLCTDYVSLCVYAAVFGVSVSATYAIQMMCIMDIVGIEKSTSAFGILQLLQGIATILGTPLAGWLYDHTGAYDPTFYTSGAWMALSGVMLLPIPWILSQWQQ